MDKWNVLKSVNLSSLWEYIWVEHKTVWKGNYIISIANEKNEMRIFKISPPTTSYFKELLTFSPE